MDFKIEPNDGLLSVYKSKDNSYEDRNQNDVKLVCNRDQIFNDGFNVRIKEEIIDSNLPEDVNDVAVVRQSIKQEDDLEWKKFQFFFSEDIFPIKAEKDDNLSSSSTHKTPHKIPKTEPEFSTTSRCALQNVAESKLVIPVRKSIIQETGMQNDIFKQELVAVIVLKRNSFFQRNFVCIVCFDVFSSSENLKIHKTCHENSKTHCKNYTTTKKATETPFKCSQCDYKTRYPSKFKRHRMSHTGEKPFKCDICDFKCAHLYYLKIHKISHTGDKPVVCDQCDFKCFHLSVLKMHKLSHTGEKLLRCDQCDFKTNRSWHLNSHKLIHSGKKPFECDQCDYKTAYFYNLKGHQVTHTGEKRFKCDLCNYKCAISSNLLIHKRKHTGEKPYKCDECDYKSTTSSHLKRHKLTHVNHKK